MSENNRRSVLKKIGTATAGLTLASAQPVSAASCSETLDIRVWPSADFSNLGGRNDFPEAYDVEDALDNFLGQLESADAIGSGTATVSSSTIYDEFGISLTTNSNDCAFDSTDKSDIRDDIYASSYDEDVHVIVAKITNFANASGGDHNAYLPDDDANKEGTGFAWVGTEGPYPGTNEPTERYKNLSIQEVGHVIVDDSYTSAGDHAMGKIKKETYDPNLDVWYGPVTPLATFYENSHEDNNPCPSGIQEDAAHSGTCSNNAVWNDSHTRDVTSCTIDGVKQTCINRSGAY